MCNCQGGKKQVINNLDSPDHVGLAKDVFKSIISGKDVTTFNQLDLIEISNAYLSLYPNVKGTPTVDEMIGGIKQGIELYDVKYRR